MGCVTGNFDGATDKLPKSFSVTREVNAILTHNPRLLLFRVSQPTSLRIRGKYLPSEPILSLALLSLCVVVKLLGRGGKVENIE